MAIAAATHGLPISPSPLGGASRSTKATSAIPYAGHYVLVQRRNALGQWVSLKRVALKSSTVATRTAVRLPKGLSRIRILMPQSQVGTGYGIRCSADRSVDCLPAM